ncbi:PREDICTED: single-stranded DNA-bindig protein WHY2, mitochondrial isoform X2 [Lupinus angustifolius]|uniref:single-stranded DNA-bindig protein WHY2, mitochondrial isoform X2 n=1 Tax=Lupinus angustifolius TaxID=3871 RepID=UPI00092F5750|nr:PREDICTED: single-stranded DNA-bindig protein WHY2, mitochondrial isoform X2 [Lupinus angustifolius]
MLKLHRMLASSRHGLLDKAISFNKPSVTHHFSTSSHATVAGYNSNRILAPYSVYKGKAAFSLTPSLPTFTKLHSGAVVVDRRGSIMVIFMHAIGDRKYDWENRQRFALSATEVGSLLTMGPQDSCEFFHDPSIKSSNAGQVRKSLSIKPHANSNGYFMNLTVVNNLLNTKEFFSVPVTAAEFAVMKTACSFALPHIMGWDKMTHQQSTGGTVGLQSKVVGQQVFESEWDK